MLKFSYFTSEHVSPGHPDKIMDAIAESIVDYQLEQGYKKPRVAVDGVVKDNTIVIAGECTNPKDIPLKKIIREVLTDIGYSSDINPMNLHEVNAEIVNLLGDQSFDIAQGVDHEVLESAGDIGIMFGGAVKEAPDYTCWSHYFARLLSGYLYNWSKYNKFVDFKPDQKVQVTIEYCEGKPSRISEIIVCISHSDKLSQEEVYNKVSKYIRDLMSNLLYEISEIDIMSYNLRVNPTGRFVNYGPFADSGEVGRKIVCDQYGGFFAVGGGNLNGKDATKVDRSGVYMSRFVAKNIVAKGMADKCEIQVSYSIGQLEPVSIHVNTFGTEKVTLEEIYSFVNSFSFVPGDIIKRFKLNSPLSERKFSYRSLGKYGHIGNTGAVNIPWEEIV